MGRMGQRGNGLARGETRDWARDMTQGMGRKKTNGARKDFYIRSDMFISGTTEYILTYMHIYVMGT